MVAGYSTSWHSFSYPFWKRGFILVVNEEARVSKPVLGRLPVGERVLKLQVGTTNVQSRVDDYFACVV